MTQIPASRGPTTTVRAMALDVGSRTIGLALGDRATGIASAWEVLRRQGEVADVAELLKRAEAREIDVLVVGLPLELDGRVGHRARLVRRICGALQRAIADAGLDLQIVEWDERFSTAAAERTLLEADVSRKRRKATIDAVAAQFILQGWLDHALASPEN